MSWKVVEISSFIKERKGKFKPDNKEIQGLKRIEKINFSGKIFLSDKSSKTNMILVKNGDLIISGINVAKGAMAIYSGKEDVKATIHYSSYIYDKEKIDIEFLNHFLKSQTFINAIKEQIPGGIKTEIKPKHILPLKVFIPTKIHGQRKIVEILNNRNSVVNGISTALTHQLDLVKKLRQSFLREAMQGKLIDNGELKIENEETGTELLAKIKAEKKQLINGGKIRKPKPLPPITKEQIPFEIPDSWVWCRLGELAIKRDGERKPISQSERERREKIYDYYGASGVIDQIDGFTHDGKFVLIGEDGANLKAKSTPIAFIAEGKFWVNNHAHVLEFVDDITNYFMTYCLNIIDINPYITGGFQPKLSQGNLIQIEIPLPPLSEQKRIVAKLDELMSYCDSLEESIKNSQTENEMLLHQVLREALEPKTESIKEEVKL